jgi:hypothetical protein
MYARSAARLRSERTHNPEAHRTPTTSHHKVTKSLDPLAISWADLRGFDDARR